MQFLGTVLCLLASASIVLASPVANPQALFCDTDGLVALMNGAYTGSPTLSGASPTATDEDTGGFGAQSFDDGEDTSSAGSPQPTTTTYPAGCDVNQCPDVTNKSPCMSQNLDIGDLGAVVGCVGWDPEMIAQLCGCANCVSGLDVLYTVGFCPQDAAPTPASTTF